MSTILIFDTETTSREKDREIIEAAYLRLQPGADLNGPDPHLICRPPAILERFSRRYKPSRKVGFGSIAVHGILPHELEGCEPSSAFKLPADTAYIIGHSIDFDWEAAGKPDIKRIDTCAIAEHLWPDTDSHGQVALTYMIQGASEATRETVRNAHSALADCHLNLALLVEILKLNPQLDTWEQLWQYSEDCRIPLAMPFTDARGTPLTETDRGLLEWCMSKGFVHAERPYLIIGIRRELERRDAAGIY